MVGTVALLTLQFGIQILNTDSALMNLEIIADQF